MVTRHDWEEFLYSCGLVGQQWLHVNRVGAAYICWRLKISAPSSPSPWNIEVQRMIDAFRVDPEGGEERLAQFLAEAHYGADGALSIISEESQERIIKMLHYIVNEKPNPQEWVN